MGVAERLVAHLEQSRIVVIRKPIPAAGAGDNPGRRGFEGKGSQSRACADSRSKTTAAMRK
jgi:hypothetical protein